MRFAPERRASVRFEAGYAGTLDARPAEVLDLSLTGARLVVGPGPGVPAEVTATIEVANESVQLRAAVRSVRRDPDGRLEVGIEFADGQDPERARLALALFRTHVVPAGEDDSSGAAAVAA